MCLRDSERQGRKLGSCKEVGLTGSTLGRTRPPDGAVTLLNSALCQAEWKCRGGGLSLQAAPTSGRQERSTSLPRTPICSGACISAGIQSMLVPPRLPALPSAPSFRPLAPFCPHSLSAAAQGAGALASHEHLKGPWWPDPTVNLTLTLSGALKLQMNGIANKARWGCLKC